MAKKRILKIPRNVKIKCPSCGKNNMIKMPEECIYSFECRKCRTALQTPIMKCCIICAYGNSECTPNLLREARSKGLEIRNL